MVSSTLQYYFTVDYTDNEVADDPAQHKQSRLELLDAGEYTGNIVALPNNRVRVTHPAWLKLARCSDFRPNQHIYQLERKRRLCMGYATSV